MNGLLRLGHRWVGHSTSLQTGIQHWCAFRLAEDSVGGNGGTQTHRFLCSPSKSFHPLVVRRPKQTICKNKRHVHILNVYIASVSEETSGLPLPWDYHIHGWMLCTSVNARYIWHTVFATFALALSFDSSMAWVSVNVEADSGTAHTSFIPMTLWRADDCAVHTVRMSFSFGRLCSFALYASLRPTMLTPQTKRSWMGSTLPCMRSVWVHCIMHGICMNV